MSSIVIPILALLFAVAWVFWQRAKQQALEQEVAEALGLTRQSETGRLHGKLGGVPVEVYYTTRGSGKARHRVTELAARADRCTVSARTERLGGSIARRLLGGVDLATGDPTFDGAAVLSGNPADVAAAMDASTRSAVFRLLQRGGSVASGRVAVEHRSHLISASFVRAELEQLTTIAAALNPAMEPLSRLERIVKEDPMPGVRRNALRHLDRLDAAVGRRVAAEASVDPDAQVRIAALLVLGEDVALAEQPAYDLAAAALLEPTPVCSALSRAGAEAALVALLDEEEAEVRIAAADGLARVGTVAAVPRLRSLHGGLLGDAAVQRAATAALASIHARVGDFGDGRVSIAEAGGEVSVVAAGGELSMARQRETG